MGKLISADYLASGRWERPFTPEEAKAYCECRATAAHGGLVTDNPFTGPDAVPGFLADLWAVGFASWIEDHGAIVGAIDCCGLAYPFGGGLVGGLRVTPPISPGRLNPQQIADQQAEAAALARMQAEMAALAQSVESHQAELLAAQAAQDAAREAAALAAMQATIEEHVRQSELLSMYQQPPPGSPYSILPKAPDNLADLTKAQLKDWLAAHAYPDAYEEGAKHQLADYTATQLRDMANGVMPLPVIVSAPAVAAKAPLPAPVNPPPLAAGTGLDQFMTMDKAQVVDWIIVNWYAGNAALRPVLEAYDLGQLISMIADRSGV